MEQYQLIVCGGGCAGFCAAVAAARMGIKTALVEKYNTPGGILTVLGSCSIDQFNDPFRKDGKMVIGGIGWELVRRLQAEGFARIPDMDAPWENHEQYGVKVNPVAAAKIMDDMLLHSGVHLRYGQSVVDARVREGRIESILVSTREGLRRLTAQIYMDCTGDGELAAFAGASFEAGDGRGTFQPGTLRYYPAVAGEDRILNFGDNKNHVPMDVTDSDALVTSEIAARRMIYEQLKQGDPIMAVAPAVAPREGRRIAGLSRLEAGDYCSGRVFSDSLCYSYWFVDIHRQDGPALIQYITHGNTPTIPLSAMISRDLPNLMMAGRNISSDRAANSALRVKASCMSMGQAAATAAAVAIRTDVPVARVSIPRVLPALEDSGAIVPGKNKTFEEMMTRR